MIDLTRRHWLIAVLIAGLAHVALVLALMHRSAPPLESRLGMTIELGAGGRPTAGGAGGSPGADALQSVASPSSRITPTRVPTPVAVASLVPESAPKTSERVQADRPTTQPLIAKARPEATPEPISEPTPAPEPVPEPASEPASRPSTASTQPSESQATPEQDSTKPSQSRARAGDEAEAERGGERPSDATAGSGGRGDGSGHVGSNGAGGSGGGNGEVDASNYYGRLATWVLRHQDYPIQARRLRQEGTVKVTFTVDQNGRVISQRISESSGHEPLDREAQAMLERASPLPRIPASLGRSRLTITLPIAFSLR
jgi:protein TonB